MLQAKSHPVENCNKVVIIITNVVINVIIIVIIIKLDCVDKFGANVLS